MSFAVAFLGCLVAHLVLIQGVSTFRDWRTSVHGKRRKAAAKAARDSGRGMVAGSHVFVRGPDGEHEACVECGLHRDQYEHEIAVRRALAQQNELFVRIEAALDKAAAIGAIGMAFGGLLKGAAAPAKPKDPTAPAEGVPQ